MQELGQHSCRRRAVLVAVEDIQHEHFHGVARQQPAVAPQDSALIGTPDLRDDR